jgi:two-component system OmpR family sensor kinase
VRLPIRTRLTLLFAGMTLAVLAVAAAALLLGFRAEMRRTVDEGLLSLSLSMRDDPASAVDALAPSDEVFAQYIHRDGTIVTSSGIHEPLLPATVTDGLGAPRSFDREVTTFEERVPARILASPVDGGILVVGVDIEDRNEAVARLATLVGLGGPVLLLALSFVGWTLARAALRPVEELRSEASAISTSEPDRRLRVPETGDELQRLAETLNGMLDRMREALDRERRLVDEASHELRTPLGVLKAEVDLALKEPRTREELEAALRSISQETERIRRLAQDLLVLARSGHGRLPVHRTDVDLSDIIGRVVAEFAGRARAEGVDLRTSGDGARARVDSDRVRQAVENLVDNALRHVGRGGSVEIRSERDGSRARIVVSDTGTGFPPELLDRAFEPFARADDDGGVYGAGLALTIVRAVAVAQGGSATARNLEDGGAAVGLEISV